MALALLPSRRGLLALALLVLSAAAAVAQVPVSGTVTDAADNAPLIGVNVVVQGTTTGTVTDYDGAYELSAAPGAVLEFSYVGYLPQRQTIEAGRTNFPVSLRADAAELESVVVVGYGTQRKSDLTGSISSISEDEIKQLPVTGLDQAIQGRAAGVYVTQNSGAPGGSVSIRIRGIGSVNGGEPLYVVDGVPFNSDNTDVGPRGGQSSNPLNTINPNDITSIEILKDASASAIYGSRAANGVVLITTRRGTAGKSTVSYETYVSGTQISKQIDVLDLREYAQYYTETRGRIQEFNRPELLGAGTNWQDEIFQRGLTQNHQLSITGGSDRTQFSLSGGLNNQSGIVIGSGFERFSGRFSVDHKLAPKLRVGASLLFSRTDEQITFNDNSQGVVFTALLLPPSVGVRNADGTFAGPDPDLNITFDNPVANALQNDDRNRKTRALSNLYFEADLMPWLKYRTELGTDINYGTRRSFQPEFQRGDLFGQSSLTVNQNNGNFWINKHLLTYDQRLAEIHQVTMLAGFEAQASNYEYFGASRRDFPNNVQQQLDLGDAGNAQNYGGAGENALMSWFGRLNYGLKDKYLLTVTGRFDGSSRFSQDDRWGFFPSTSLAWRVSEEPFLENVSVIDNLKLRVGWGQVGNQNIGNYSYLANLRGYAAVFGDQLITSYAPANIPNPNVRWEASEQANVGIDLGLIDNRIAITLDAYLKRANGMLLPAILPNTAGGFDAPFVNAGQIDNSGIELTVNTVNTTGKLSWNTSANFTYNYNEVVSLGSTGALIGVLEGLPLTRTVEGRSLGEFYGYRTDGIFQSLDEIAEAPFQSDRTLPGDYKFVDQLTVDTDGDGVPDAADGVINADDQTFIGNPIPDFTANLNNTFEYRGFTASVFVQGVFGNEIMNLLGRNVTSFVNTSNQRVDILDRWRPDAPSLEVPRAIFDDPNDNRRISDRYVEDGSFVRLRSASLGYQIPRAVRERLRLTSGKFYVSAQNLFTWTKYEGYDPEVGSYNQQVLLNGIDNGRYPNSQSITVGLNANF